MHLHVLLYWYGTVLLVHVPVPIVPVVKVVLVPVVPAIPVDLYLFTVHELLVPYVIPVDLYLFTVHELLVPYVILNVLVDVLPVYGT